MVVVPHQTMATGAAGPHESMTCLGSKLRAEAPGCSGTSWSPLWFIVSAVNDMIRALTRYVVKRERRSDTERCSIELLVSLYEVESTTVRSCPSAQKVASSLRSSDLIYSRRRME